jgi:hypothetical protein
VVDVPASNTDGFLLRDTCVSFTQLNKPFFCFVFKITFIKLTCALQETNT